MLEITLKYFLNKDGLEYFPQWYGEIAKEGSQQPGFIKISCTNESTNPIVHLCFEDAEKLQKWISKKSHDELAEKISEYCIKDTEVKMNEL